MKEEQNQLYDLPRNKASNISNGTSSLLTSQNEEEAALIVSGVSVLPAAKSAAVGAVPSVLPASKSAAVGVVLDLAKTLQTVLNGGEAVGQEGTGGCDTGLCILPGPEQNYLRLPRKISILVLTVLSFILCIMPKGRYRYCALLNSIKA